MYDQANESEIMSWEIPADIEFYYSPFFGTDLAMPEWEAIITLVLLSAVILTTIIGNILVIMSVLKYTPLRITPNFFIVSLAAADLTVSLVVLPVNVIYTVVGRWIFGSVICKMWLTSDVLCCTSSILHLCAIALDRYYALHDPIEHARRRTGGFVGIAIAVVWLVSCIICLPPLIGWNDWPDHWTDETPCDLTKEPGYVVYSSLGSFYIPLAIIIFVYLKIFQNTRRRLRKRAQASNFQVLKSQQPNSSAAGLGYGSSRRGKPSQSKNGRPTGGTCSGAEEIPLVPSSSANGKPLDTRACVQEKNAGEVVVILEPAPTQDENGTNQTKSPSRRKQHILAKVKREHGKFYQKENPRKISKNFELGPNGSARTSLLGPNSSSKTCLKASSSINQDDASSSSSPPIVKANPHESDAIHRFINEKAKQQMAKERRAARTMAVVVTTFIVCWLPFFIMYIILPFCSACDPSPKVINFITWLGYVNSTLNPIIYTIFNTDFRQAFRKILTCQKIR